MAKDSKHGGRAEFDSTVDPALAHTGQDVPGLTHVRASARAKLFGDQVPVKTIGRYRVARTLGAGGMGVVYEVFDPQLQRRAALKMLRGERAPQATHRFVQEARTMARLSHPNIAHVYEVGEIAGDAFIAMELIEGVTLRTWQKTGPRTWQAIVTMYLEVGRGLVAAHRAGIVHRDFKPDNVMVDDEGRPRVLDFGLAHAQREHADAEAIPTTTDLLTLSGTIHGTPGYMAAEQFKGAPTDARTDQFAFAVSLFEALTGVRPFTGSTLAELAEQIEHGRIAVPELGIAAPRDLLTTLRPALHPEPNERFASLQVMLDELARALRPRSRKRIAWIGILAVLATGGAALGWALTRPAAPDEPIGAAEGPEWLARSALPETMDAPLSNDPLGVTIHRLSNGLTVYVSPRHDLPRVTVRTIVGSGFAEDPEHNAGIAHLTARLLQNGTSTLGTTDAAAERAVREGEIALYEAYATADPARRAELARELEAIATETARWTVPAEIDALYDELGIAFSFEVTADATVFSAEVPSNQLETWAEIEADKLQHPAFRNFLGAVEMAMDEAQRPSIESRVDAVRRLVHGNTPRGGRALGDAESLATLPYERVSVFHRQWYAPNNTAIVLVGDVDPATVVPMLERHFQSWAPRVLPSRNPTVVMRAPSEPLVVPSRFPDEVTVAYWPMSASRDLVTLLGDVATISADEPDDPKFSFDVHWAPDLVEFTSTSTTASAPEIRDQLAQQLMPATLATFDDAALGRAWAALQHEQARARDQPALAGDRIADAHVELAWSDQVAFVGGSQPTRERLQELAVDVFTAGPFVVQHQQVDTPEPPAIAAPVRLDAPMVEPGDRLRSDRARQLAARAVPQLEPKFLVRGRDYELYESPHGTVATARCDDLVQIEVTYSLDPARFMHCGALVNVLIDAASEPNQVQRLEAPIASGMSCSMGRGVSTFRYASEGRPESYGPSWYAFVTPHDIARRISTEPSPAIEWVDTRAPHIESNPALLHVANFRGESARGLLFGSQPAPADELTQLLERPQSVAYCGPDPARAARDLEVGPPPQTAPAPVGAAFPVRMAGASVGVDVRGASNFDAQWVIVLPTAGHRRALESVFREYMNAPRLGAFATAIPAVDLRANLDRYGEVSVSGAGSIELVARTLDAVDEILSRPADRARFEAARALAERRMRTDWLTRARIPSAVLQWYAEGHLTDPRAQAWQDLATLTFEEFEALLEAVRTGERHLSIIADRRALDRAVARSIEWKP